MNRNNIISIFLIILVFFAVIFFSCSYSGSESSGGGSSGGGGGDEITIPIETILFKDIAGYTVFKTNDSSFLDTSGSTIWIWGDYYEDPMTTFEAEISKESGVNGYGYGLIFCVQDDTVPSDGINDKGYNFLTVLVNNGGEYCIVRCTDSNKDGVLEENYIKTWCESSDLNKGYGVKNILKVTYTGNTSGIEKFELVINNTTPIEFEYDQIIPFDICGRYGYITVLAPNENFPVTPVITKYKQNIPADILLPSLAMSLSLYGKESISSNILDEYTKNIKDNICIYNQSLFK